MNVTDVGIVGKSRDAQINITVKEVNSSLGIIYIKFILGTWPIENYHGHLIYIKIIVRNNYFRYYYRNT